jgi:hypothetical protein
MQQGHPGDEDIQRTDHLVHAFAALIRGGTGGMVIETSPEPVLKHGVAVG